MKGGSLMWSALQRARKKVKYVSGGFGSVAERPMDGKIFVLMELLLDINTRLNKLEEEKK